MNTKTVFIGGSRDVSRLSAQVKDRLNNVIKSGHRVIVGDANGVDKAVQKHLGEARYDLVTVFCSGDSPRNNIGQWHTHKVTPPRGAKGFQFYAAKDREMAREADFGLMIWDSKSAGTVLNVLRLVRAGKIAVLINVPEKTTINIKSTTQWNEFLSLCSQKLRDDLRERATPHEWEPAEANSDPMFFDADAQEQAGRKVPPAPSEDELAAAMNEALAAGDPTSVVDALGNIARARGMTLVAKETGLARESLYRSLAAGGNPEFATVLKVMAALGLRLEASKTHTGNAA
ncbi:MAG: putative addiction module antidote protein [Mesorhizobium sp.]|uniref:addiction module antidote protein n=1 Tax=Mesorhizobium sp. TaxID=1871066 RepID=UPI0011FE97CA|nr:addiction module antidote protein [Mesorhizobium sp.]TIO17531.1 MAG: putative addiction module antidote protein [Mesorhizobium sp.]TIP84454.1 MAG: putative addiction module antidote protein [Mesorhizobium sp.]TIP92357.1 MAG: putative addiction module antidote protein [Mesorhizobium sp.]